MCMCRRLYTEPTHAPAIVNASGIWTIWFCTLSALCWVTGSSTPVSSLTACSLQPCPPSSCLTSTTLPLSVSWSLPTSLPASLWRIIAHCAELGSSFSPHSWLSFLCLDRVSTRAGPVSTFGFEHYLEKWGGFCFHCLHISLIINMQVRTEKHFKKIT